MFNAYNPAWDPQGDYIYFLSDREFAPQISQIEFNYATNRDAYIYAMSLRKDVKHPFPQRCEVGSPNRTRRPNRRNAAGANRKNLRKISTKIE